MARKAKKVTVANFRALVWRYYRQSGRHNLPWRATHDPYRILVSEVMLQQTQVLRVIPKYHEFVRRFPNFRSLARASIRNVLHVWSGLGYNRRALYVKRTAETVEKDFAGKLPADIQTLKTFPGIGPNTAGSIAAFAFNEPASFIETNIRRALIHHFFVGLDNVPDKKLLAIVQASIPSGKAREWYYALMDYGSMLGTALPKHQNPNRRSKHYVKQARFENSDRKIRGDILRTLLRARRATERALAQRTGASLVRTKRILRTLEHERFIRRTGRFYGLAQV